MQIADSGCEDSSSTSLAGRLTSGDPAQVLCQASLILQVAGTRTTETEGFLADATQLASVQQEQQHTEEGIAQLAGQMGKTRDHIASLLSKQLGCLYVCGGTGPCGAGFDCSGLVLKAWAAADITIPRDTYSQWAALPHIAASAIQPGDLLFYNGIGHVAMYVGNGMIIDAPTQGQPVRELPMNESWYAGSFDGAARPLSPGGSASLDWQGYATYLDRHQ